MFHFSTQSRKYGAVVQPLTSRLRLWVGPANREGTDARAGAPSYRWRPLNKRGTSVFSNAGLSESDLGLHSTVAFTTPELRYTGCVVCPGSCVEHSGVGESWAGALAWGLHDWSGIKDWWETAPWHPRAQGTYTLTGSSGRAIHVLSEKGREMSRIRWLASSLHPGVQLNTCSVSLKPVWVS